MRLNELELEENRYGLIAAIVTIQTAISAVALFCALKSEYGFTWLVVCILATLTSTGNALCIAAFKMNICVKWFLLTVAFAIIFILSTLIF